MSTSLTPWSWLDDPAAFHLTADRVLRVEGTGSRAWLNSLLTADLRPASPGMARYGLLLSPTGGIESDSWVVECPTDGSDRLAVVLPATRARRVHALLERYVLNADVTLTFDDAVRVVTLLGDRAPQLVTGPLATLTVYSTNRLRAGGIDMWVPVAEVDRVMERLSVCAAEMGGGIVDGIAWSSARVVLGVPLAGADFDETTSPHEAGLEHRAISFSKGCYIGQEFVARQQRRGQLARRLVQLEVEGAGSVAEGSPMRDLAGAEAGRITSVASPGGERGSLLALGYVAPSLAEPGTRMRLNERAARVRRVVGCEFATPERVGRPLAS